MQAEQQRQDAVRPVVVGGLRSEGTDSTPHLLRFSFQLTNRGTGPALDVRATIYDTDAYDYDWRAETRAIILPMVLGPGEPALVGFSVRESAEGNALLDRATAGAVTGGILITYRDSYNRGFATRAQLEAGERNGSGRDREVKIASQMLELPTPSRS
jgi:hypothetical protein